MTVYNKGQREIWVDNVKVIACVLVVLGHFFQSMVKSEIMAETDLFLWFNQTIYYFHVPLFFICSGYLYQKLSCVNSIKSWKGNILKKALSLGVPYFTFSIISWFIKNVLSSQVNNGAGGFVDSIFISPMPPYWFLYALFFIFIVTPTFNSKKKAVVALIISIVLRILLIIGRGHLSLVPYGVLRIMEYEIWFVIGMGLCLADFKEYIAERKGTFAFAFLLGIVFIVLSILVYILGIEAEIVGIILCALACFSIIILIIKVYIDNNQSPLFGFMSRYTMPLFLMHTIFAAGIRIVLFKLGITEGSVHILAGLFISFAGPIIAAMIMNKVKPLDFLLYPTKYIKIK